MGNLNEKACIFAVVGVFLVSLAWGNGNAAIVKVEHNDIDGFQ
jgi:hypothetical protein